MKYLMLLIAAFAMACGSVGQTTSIATRERMEELGRDIFFDNSLSDPAGQSCATCHRPERAFSDTLRRTVSEGATHGLFAKRNAMTIAYSSFVPPLHFDSIGGVYVGGLFWDGRVDSVAQQARLPFVDALEMGNVDNEAIVAKIKRAPYFLKFNAAYPGAVTNSQIFDAACSALAIYQASDEVNKFSSKFDAVLAGQDSFSDQELAGMELFDNKGKCSQCHSLTPDPVAKRVLFTDHTYDNLGIPRNPSNPFYHMVEYHNPLGLDFIDLGLGATVNNEDENGKFRVPTLRNVALTAPYGHNGYFETLDDIVHFYNVRDVDNSYPHAEYPATVNRDEMGSLGLTPTEERAIVAFMLTLSDK